MHAGMVQWVQHLFRARRQLIALACETNSTFFQPVEETSEYIASGNNYRLIEMDAAKENGVSDSRAVYTPPVVVRISDLKQGAGLCVSTGSGDSGVCDAYGNTAGSNCTSNGNGASGACVEGSTGHH